MVASSGVDLPETMQSIGFDAPGGPDVLRLQTSPLPRLRPDDVLIRVAYAGVNRPDCLQRAGAYPPPPGASALPGREVAGVVKQERERVTNRKALAILQPHVPRAFRVDRRTHSQSVG